MSDHSKTQNTVIVDENGDAVLVSAAGAIAVDIVSGSSSGTEYADGDARGTATGGLIMGDDGALIQSVAVDSSGHLQVDVLTGGGAGTQYDDGDARGTATGNLMMGDDGTLVQAVSVDSSGDLQVDVLTVDGVAAEGAALGNGILLQGDDGTDRQNVAVDTSGNLQVDIVAGAGVAAEGAALGDGVLIQGDDGTDRQNVAVNTSGEVQVEVTDQNNPTVAAATFTLTSTTAWTTVVTIAGGSFCELRMLGFGNSSATLTNVQFRFGTSSAFFIQPCAANGGAFNENLIGAYLVGGDGENLQVSSTVSVASVVGHVITRTI